MQTGIPQEETNAANDNANDDENANDEQSKSIDDDTLTIRLPDESVFNCDSCKELLRPPVYHVADAGTVCKTCTDENNWTQQNPLKKFDALLGSIAVTPCTNEKCETSVLAGKLERHLTQHCQQRPVRCLSEKCSWNGPLCDLVRHFETEHPDDVMENRTFTFDSRFSVSKLLIREDCKLIAVLRREKDDIFYNMYAQQKTNFGRVVVRHVGNGNQDVTLDMEVSPLNVIDQHRDGVKINVAFLNSMLGDDGDSKSVAIEIPKSKADKLLELLKCSGCLQLMKPPIFTCEGGHSVCENCSTNLLECSLCCHDINTKVRNLSLEAFTSDLFYPCMNRSRGCEAGIAGTRLADHESKCFYTHLACPYDNCEFEGNCLDFKEHVKQNHTKISLANNVCLNFKAGKGLPENIYVLFTECYLFEIFISFYPQHTPLISYCRIRNLLPTNRYLNHCCNIGIRDRKTSREMRFGLLLTKDTTPAKVTFPNDAFFGKNQFFDGATDLNFSVVFEHQTNIR